MCILIVAASRSLFIQASARGLTLFNTLCKTSDINSIDFSLSAQDLAFENIFDSRTIV